MLTPREVAQSRYDEARSVAAAFTSQVGRRREAWRRAAPADAVKMRRALKHAVEQEAAAQAREAEAWKALHSLPAEIVEPHTTNV